MNVSSVSKNFDLKMMSHGNLLNSQTQMEISKVDKLAQEFEAIFLQIVLKSMRDTVPKDGMLDGGNGEEIFKGMLDGQYAKAMSEQGSSGIARAVANQLKGLMGAASAEIDRVKGQKMYKSE